MISRSDFIILVAVGIAALVDPAAYEIFIPQVSAPGSVLRHRLGCQIEGYVSNISQYLIPNRAYQIPVRLYEWPSAAHLSNLSYLSGYDKVITVKCVPEHMRLWPGFAGSPPHPDRYDEFISMTQDVINRSGAKGIEMFNEPDIRKRDAAFPDFYGAWVGDDESYYDGGRRYGQLCAYAYPRLYGSKIIAGALMMHEYSLEFLRGAIDGGLRADAISYHCYIWGRADFGRIFEIAGNIAQFSRLPLIATETSLLGDGSLQHQTDKADYLTYIINTMPTSDLDAVMWYTLGGNDWNNSDLLPGSAYQVWAQ